MINFLIYWVFLDLLGLQAANFSICRSPPFRVQTKLDRFENILQTENHCSDLEILHFKTHFIKYLLCLVSSIVIVVPSLSSLPHNELSYYQRARGRRWTWDDKGVWDSSGTFFVRDSSGAFFRLEFRSRKGLYKCSTDITSGIETLVPSLSCKVPKPNCRCCTYNIW